MSMPRVLVLVLAMLACSKSYSQSDTVDKTRGRKTELSFSLSIQSFPDGGGSSSTSGLLAFRGGFPAYEGLCVEPEFVALFGGAGVMVNGNLVYNFFANTMNVPYVLAGYGIANAIPSYNVPAVKLSLMRGVLNLGVGVKMFITDNVAIRGSIDSRILWMRVFSQRKELINNSTLFNSESSSRCSYGFSNAR
jgi:hypothetical protein